MRQSLATILVAYAGLTFLPYAFIAPAGLASGHWLGTLPYLAVGLAGIYLIVRRGPIGAWVVGDAQDDGTAMALGLVRAIGLILVVTAIGRLPLLFFDTGLPAAIRLNLALQAGFVLVKLAFGIFALGRPERFVAVLDTAERPLGESVTADVVFGAVALWVLIRSIPQLAQAGTRTFQEVARGAAPLWSAVLPELAGSAIAVVLGLWAFFGRARLARAWYRMHPTGRP